MITRAVGVSQDVKADFFEVDLKPGDKVLMCSDGLSNMIEDDRLFDVINANNVEGASALIVTAVVKNRSGYERSGEPTNELGNGWGVYDLGLANENLLLKAAEMGIGTLVMGIRDEKKLHEILSIPEEQMVVSVIGVGYGTVSPDMPKRKSVEDVAVIC